MLQNKTYTSPQISSRQHYVAFVREWCTCMYDNYIGTRTILAETQGGVDG